MRLETTLEVRVVTVPLPPVLFEGDSSISVSSEKTVIAMGFGCDRTAWLNLRLPGYLLPALHLWRSFPSRAKPRIEFYFAQHFLAVLSGDAERVKWWVDAAIDYLRAYMNYFHPEVPARFLRDRPIQTGSPEDALLDELASYLQSRGDKQLLRFAERRGGWTALRYMAAHALYMRDPLLCLQGVSPLVVDGAEEYDTVIMVGGPPERIFWKVRELLRQLGCHQQWQSLQLFTPIGRRPVYHHIQGEPVVGESAELPGDVRTFLTAVGDNDVVRDLLYLLVDASGTAEFSLVARRRQLLDEDWSLLQRGWCCLRSFLSGS